MYAHIQLWCVYRERPGWGCACWSPSTSLGLENISEPRRPGKVKVKIATQLCSTFCSPMDCNLLGSSVHGILQARILECVAIPFSRGLSQSGRPPRKCWKAKLHDVAGCSCSVVKDHGINKTSKKISNTKMNKWEQPSDIHMCIHTHIWLLLSSFPFILSLQFMHFLKVPSP